MHPPVEISAQEATGMIRTSADNHDNKFFGQGVLQVLFIAPDSDDDSVIEDLSVEIEAIPQSGASGSDSIMVPETSQSSGRFEFYLAHIDSVITAASIDPINTDGMEADDANGDGDDTGAPFLTFGPTGNISSDSDLYENTRFTIRADDLEIVINYKETIGILELDRDAYGSNSFVYIAIHDQDANLNPTQVDQFTVDPNNDPNNDLFGLNGGTFEDSVVFEETGDNTGIFEGRFQLGVAIDVHTESLVLTLHEKANYDANLDAVENDSNETDEVSFTVGNSGGTVNIGGSRQHVPTFDPVIATDKEVYVEDETVHIIITDQDANANSNMVDSVRVVVLSSESDAIELFANETGVNNGVFEASILLASETNSDEGTLAASNNVTIRYTDERPADYFESVQAGANPEKDFVLSIVVEVKLKTGREAMNVGAPILEAQPGREDQYRAGTSFTISTTVTNNNGISQPFVILLEVRDSNDVTHYLSWHGSTLLARGTTDIGVLWQPDVAGMYQIRTFAISSINSAVVLSPIASSQVAIYESLE